MNQLPQLILFDFDRTIGYLYRDPAVLGDLKTKVLEAYSGADMPEVLLGSLSPDGYHAWHRLHDWALANMAPDLADALNAGAERVVADFEVERVGQTDLIPSAAEALVRIARLVPVGIVSSNSTRAIQRALEDAGIRDLFGYVGGRETAPFLPANLKPSPLQLELALARIGRSAEDTWYVGDDVIDVTAAHAAGLKSVSVATGVHSADQLASVGPELVVPSLSELATVIESL